jgi:hypothetical protein
MSNTSSINTRGIPSEVCLNCGGTTFKILARFTDSELSWYTTNGYCIQCESPVTVPTPLDNPDVLEFDYEF